MTTGRISLMRYNDWKKDALLLVERIKIKMRDQDVDFFDYGGRLEPPPLLNENLYSRQSRKNVLVAQTYGGE